MQSAALRRRVFGQVGNLPMSRSRCRVAEPDRPHFVTCTMLDWLPVLTRPKTVGILLDAPVFKQRHADFHLNPVKRG
jgi:hypothetical protein